MDFLHQDKNSLISIELHIQPRAAKNELCGLHGTALKIRIKAPPVDGKANAMIIAFFAKLLKLPKKNLQISSGALSRNKRLQVSGLPLAEIQTIITDAIKT